jgi:hypothetical protein
MLETVMAIHVLALALISKKRDEKYRKWEEIIDKVNKELSLSVGVGVSRKNNKDN